MDAHEIPPEAADSPRWTCPTCGKQFALANQSHACGVWSLDVLFEGKPLARELFEAFRVAVEAIGPSRMEVSRNAISFLNDRTFVDATPRSTYLQIGLLLTRASDSPRFKKVQPLARESVAHSLELRQLDEIDDELAEFLREAYAVGARSPRKSR